MSLLAGNCALAQRFIQRVIDIAAVTPVWTYLPECFRGIDRADRADGPRHLREAMKKLYKGYSWYLGVLARGLLARGEIGEARETLQETLANAAARKLGSVTHKKSRARKKTKHSAA